MPSLCVVLAQSRSAKYGGLVITVSTLTAELAAARLLAGGPKASLQEKLVVRQNERATIEIRIQWLDSELRIVDDRRQKSEALYIRLRDEVSELDDVSADRDDLLDFYKQKLRSTERELVETRAERDDAVAVLGGYQAEEIDRNTKPSQSSVAPLRNRDVTVPLYVRDADFPSQQSVTVTFKWYCTTCEYGGELTYDRCPHCRRHALLRDHSEEISFDLPDDPVYTSITLDDVGYFDAPSAPRGKVQVLLARRG